MSAEESFEELYRLHSGSVRAWLRSRVGVSAAEDLMQDVWLVFHHRWQRWEFPPEMEADAARPVLSFLFRTCHFVLRGHQRRRELRGEIPTDVLEAADGSKGAESVERGAEAGHALRLAQRLCPPEERDVLLAKLAGVPAREIAETLGLTRGDRRSPFPRRPGAPQDAPRAQAGATRREAAVAERALLAQLAAEWAEQARLARR